MITRAFGLEERHFQLTVAGWRDLEKLTNHGLGEIAQRLAPMVQLKASGITADKLLTAIAGGYLGTARIDDVRGPLLYGLIGGGLTLTEAGILVAKVFDDSVVKGQGPVWAWCDLAFAIVTEALIGLPDESLGDSPPKKQTAAVGTKPGRRSKTARPDS